MRCKRYIEQQEVPSPTVKQAWQNAIDRVLGPVSRDRTGHSRTKQFLRAFTRFRSPQDGGRYSARAILEQAAAAAIIVSKRPQTSRIVFGDRRIPLAERVLGTRLSVVETRMRESIGNYPGHSRWLYSSS